MMDALPLHFIRPLWLALLPLAVIIPVLWRHLRRPSGDWSKVCDVHLLRWLSVGNAAAARPSRFGPWLAGLMWLIATVALAGPSWQKLPDSSFTSLDARVLVLDLSLSMLAEDLKPNRLTQARYRLSDMLDEMLEGQTGLVAYAGDAFVVSPLTSDTNTIRNMLPALRPDIIPVSGSRPDRALELAAVLLNRSGMVHGEILLIADSGGRGAAKIAAKLAQQGIFTSVLAVGTVQGAPIPSGDGFVSNKRGNIVIARLQRDALQSIAAAGGGKYSELTTGSSTISPWAVPEGSEFARKDDALGERWKDSGPWLILVLLPLAAFSFRKGLLFVLPLLILPGLLLSTDARANLWQDLWASKDQQAQAALRQERAADAAVLAKDPAIAGEAFYRSGDFDRAGQSWSQLEQADSHYNRGNSMAQAGKFEAAIAAYDAALALDPEMEDAAFNRDLVEKMKQEKEQQDQQDSEGESSEQQSGDHSEQGEQDADPSSESQQDSEQGDEESDQQKDGEENGEPSESEMTRNWSEEDAQAMEQWLRRIPDDPGGLLRRKFRNQHQRRGAPADESETW